MLACLSLLTTQQLLSLGVSFEESENAHLGGKKPILSSLNFPMVEHMLACFLVAILNERKTVFIMNIFDFDVDNLLPRTSPHLLIWEM